MHILLFIVPYNWINKDLLISNIMRIEKENNIKSHCLLKKLRRNSVDKHNILDALFEEYSDIKQEVILTQIRDYIKVRKTEIDNSFISIYGKA